MIRRKVLGVLGRLRHEGIRRTAWFIVDACRPGRQWVLALAGPPAGGCRPPARAAVEAGLEGLIRHPREGLPEAFHRGEISGARRCFVALCDDQLAGILWVFDRAYPSQFVALGRDEAELGHGYVLERFRGRSLFRLLIHTACEALQADGYGVIYAVVDERNHASRKAFEGNGFRCIGSVSRPLSTLFGRKFVGAF